jgi:hypothetical protein
MSDGIEVNMSSAGPIARITISGPEIAALTSIERERLSAELAEALTDLVQTNGRILAKTE